MYLYSFKMMLMNSCNDMPFKFPLLVKLASQMEHIYGFILSSSIYSLFHPLVQEYLYHWNELLLNVQQINYEEHFFHIWHRNPGSNGIHDNFCGGMNSVTFCILFVLLFTIISFLHSLFSLFLHLSWWDFILPFDLKTSWQ